MPLAGELSLNLSNALPAPDVPVTPNSTAPAYFDPSRAQSPMSRWFDGSPSDGCQGVSGSTDGASPLARWLQGSPRAAEACRAEGMQKQSPFAMGPECPVPGQMYLAPLGHPLMRQMAPMMAIALCPSASNTQAMVRTGAPVTQAMIQTAAPVTQQAMPTQQLTSQQQAMPVWTPQFFQEGSSGESVASNSTTANSGVWEGMAAWKAQQSTIDEKKGLVVDRNPQGMSKRRPHGNWKETKPQHSMPNPKAIRPRGRNAISKKPADTADSVGPRAVFVDLSKILPTGIVT